MSPLLCGSGRSGSVLTWPCEPVRCPPDGGELQPELQPRAGAQGRCASHGVPESWPLLPCRPQSPGARPEGGAVVGAPDAVTGRHSGRRQCTPAAARRTRAAHTGTCPDWTTSPELLVTGPLPAVKEASW